MCWLPLITNSDNAFVCCSKNCLYAFITVHICKIIRTYSFAICSTDWAFHVSWKGGRNLSRQRGGNTNVCPGYHQTPCCQWVSRLNMILPDRILITDVCMYSINWLLIYGTLHPLHQPFDTRICSTTKFRRQNRREQRQRRVVSQLHTMLVQLDASIIYLGLNWTDCTGPVCSPFNTTTFAPVSVFQQWILPSVDPAPQSLPLYIKTTSTATTTITTTTTRRTWVSHFVLGVKPALLHSGKEP